jgi:phospholipid/cholesterol/gamma-HCH transport system substrate-binding protein
MKREVVVGAFVLAGLSVTGVVIYTIGQERRVFDGKLEYSASFPDVQGLKPGAPVRLSGVDIGTVKSVDHGPNPKDDRLYVKMEIVRSEATRIREDSIARVVNKGLLGDKMLEVTPGTPGRSQLPPGATVQSEDPTDYANMMTQLGDVARKVDQVVTNLEKTTSTFAEDGTRKDMQDSLHSMTIILNGVATGKGYAGRLINDPAEADRISHTLSRLDGTVTKLNTALDGFNMAVDRVNKGPGFAHDVIYQDTLSKSVASIGNASEEVAVSMRGIREGNGLARGLLYGGPGQEKMGENLTAMSSDLRQIVANVKAGKGTVGALLVDPSIYEDMKAVLGNVQRNDVLRALVRYSIKQDEKKPSVTVSEGAAQPDPSAPKAASAK